MAIQIRSPDGDSTDPVDQYTLCFQGNTKAMIANVRTQVGSCNINSTTTLPYTVNETEYNNSYVCSPYTMLVPYCLEEITKLDNRFLRKVIKLLITMFDNYVKNNNINRVVHINNWLLSTNLYPQKEKKLLIKRLLEDFVSRYQQHAIIFRSLNNHLNPELLSECNSAGCIAVPTRQVYLYDKTLNDYSKTHNYKIDKKLLEKTDYQYVTQNEIEESDYSRIVDLYNMLYVSKYSQHNPQFTHNYIATIIEHPYFYIEGFRNQQGILDAVGGRFTVGDTTSLPIVGYDITKPKKLGLYRLVLMSTLLYAEKNKFCFNASSGAPHFKRLRGAIPYIEYSMVYVDHFPKPSQRLWKILAFTLNKLFVPIMKRYKL